MDLALHIQQKKQDTFDRQNRVIPRNVVAVSTDTGDLRIGDGRSRWRYLAQFKALGGEDLDESDLEKDSMYSGPLHIEVLTDAEVSERGVYVPASDTLVAFETGFVVGDGIRSLTELPVYTPYTGDDN